MCKDCLAYWLLSLRYALDRSRRNAAGDRHQDENHGAVEFQQTARAFRAGRMLAHVAVAGCNIGVPHAS